MVVSNSSSLWLCLLLFLTFLRASQEAAALARVALHAQAEPSPDLIVGSVLTTSGLASALGQQYQTTYYPFVYAEMTSFCSDLIVIEGYFAMITSFIHEVRSHHRRECGGEVTVIFWSLDPDFPGPEVVAAIDFDGIATNSDKMEAVYKELGLQTMYVPLAADTKLFNLRPATISHSNEVVFVGSAGAIVANSKRFLRRTLLVAASVIDSYNARTGDAVKVRVVCEPQPQELGYVREPYH